MLGEHFVKSQLALRAWQDAGKDGLSGMLAVAFVIRNRVQAGWYSGDWIQVLAHHQDWAASEKIYTLDLPDPRNYAFGALLQEIDGIFSGSREDDVTRTANESMAAIVRFQGQSDTPVALYYGKLDDELRPWFLDNVSRSHENHKRIASVGTLTFFS